MIHVVFVRHGETGATLKCMFKHFGTQPTLTKRGFQQAIETGLNLSQHFKFDITIRSNLERTEETIECIRAQYVKKGIRFPAPVILPSLESVARTQRSMYPQDPRPVQLMWNRAEVLFILLLLLLISLSLCLSLSLCVCVCMCLSYISEAESI